MLAVETGIAHTGRLAEAKRNLAVGDLKVTECFESTGFEIGEEIESGEVAVHAAHHCLDNGTARMAFAVREPAVIAPPFVFASAGNPDGIFGKTVEALYQSVAE